MRSTLTLFLDPLIGLYVLTFAMRLAMQWVRADFRNPIVQFVLKVTNPLVMPFRKVLPPIYKLDTATAFVFVLLCWAAMVILTLLECFIAPPLLTNLGLGVLYGLRLILNMYSFIVFGYVILSWISQGGYNPSLAMVSALLSQLANPVMRPIQKIIPPIAGLDLSPIFILIALQAIAQMFYGPGLQLTANYNCSIGAIL